MNRKRCYALYQDDDVLLDAVKAIRNEGYEIKEIYTPFPVHGLDKVAGVKPTRIAKAAFIYGLIGLLFSIWMINNIMIVDWPRNIGGKPSMTFFKNLPSFIPVCFELAVYFAAHLMVITFYFKSKIGPFRIAQNPDPRTTDDHFMVELEVTDHEEEQLVNLLKNSGAVEVNVNAI